MKYEILIEDGVTNMERTVNEYLTDGWELQGGVSVVFLKIPQGGQITFEKPTFRFYQAVIKRSPPED